MIFNYNEKEDAYKHQCFVNLSIVVVNGAPFMNILTHYFAVHDINAGHRSLSGTNSCVTDRIRFLPVTMTGRSSNFNSISYTEDQHELRVTGTKCRLPDTMSHTIHAGLLYIIYY